MTDALLGMILANPALRKKAMEARELREGHLVPAVEYNWESHGYDIGLKDWKGVWVARVFIAAPLTSRKNFGQYLEEFGQILKEIGD